MNVLMLFTCYSHTSNVWNTFKIKTMGDYHDLYLKTDVLLLTDVFVKFIESCEEYYGLEPFSCFSSPGLSWDVTLKRDKDRSGTYFRY